MPAYSIKELIERKRYECSNSPTQIKYKPDENNKFVFMKGDYTDFSRMMNNLIDNAIEAGKGEQITVDVSSRVLNDNKMEKVCLKRWQRIL
ncbi:MAG: hypothetical protein LBU10_06275 [Endomicrobium sp.]|jgi:signal transduction histidine kinase|nr:hypothetical protein [Endomicrobium sp.]